MICLIASIFTPPCVQKMIVDISSSGKSVNSKNGVISHSDSDRASERSLFFSRLTCQRTTGRTGLTFCKHPGGPQDAGCVASPSTPRISLRLTRTPHKIHKFSPNMLTKSCAIVYVTLKHQHSGGYQDEHYGSAHQKTHQEVSAK